MLAVYPKYKPVSPPITKVTKSYPAFFTIYGIERSVGEGMCLTRLVNHPQGGGDVSPNEDEESCVPKWDGLGRCLVRLVNHPLGIGGLSDRHVAGKLSSFIFGSMNNLLFQTLQVILLII